MHPGSGPRDPGNVPRLSCPHPARMLAVGQLGTLGGVMTFGSISSRSRGRARWRLRAALAAAVTVGAVVPLAGAGASVTPRIVVPIPLTVTLSGPTTTSIGATVRWTATLSTPPAG